MNVLVRFCVIISMLFSMHSMALPEISPYQGVVPAQGATETQLSEQALKQVLIKVSGNVNINKLDDSKLLTKHLDDLLTQFGYQELNKKRFYYALFDKRKINSALIAMQQPIWGDTRPKPLIWLVDENKRLTSEDMIKSQQDEAVASGLQQAQLERGIDTQFPLIDLDDALAVSASDINGRFYQTVADASQRYDAEYFVVANLNKANNQQWQLSWELVQHLAKNKNNQVVIKQTNTGDKTAVMQAMLNQIADYYAQRFAILENKGQKATQVLSINNIHSLAHLMRLNALLEELNAVDTFEVINISEQQVQISVTLKGGLNSLQNALNAHSQLESNGSTVSPFHYNWQP